MAIITTWKCDRCGHSQPTGNQMWHVGIACMHEERRGHTGYEYQNFQCKALWCRTCCERVGVLPPPPPISLETQAAEPTFEEILRALIRDEIEATG